MKETMMKTMLIMLIISVFFIGSCSNKNDSIMRPIDDKTLIPYTILEKAKTDTIAYQIESNDNAAYVFYKQKPVYIIKREGSDAIIAILLLILFIVLILL